MRRLLANRKLRKTGAICLVIVLGVVLGWIIEHGGRPIWTRHSGPVRVMAYLHDKPGDYCISRASFNAVGTITYCRIVDSLDHAPFAAQVLDCRMLTVRLDDSRSVTRPSPELRWRAFLYFGQPAILMGDTDGVRRLWFGFPGEVLQAALVIGALLLAALLLVRILLELGNMLDRASDPYLRRLRFLNAGVCPSCQYDIRGLPLPRCPECGEEWTAAEIGKAHHAAAPAQR